MKLVVPMAGLCLGVSLSAAPPAPPATPDHPRAEECVRQLGSPRYRDRERAAAELVKMGRAAKPALLAGRKSPDPEVQARCEQLLPRVLALDLKHRLDRYLGDVDGKLDHDLPLLAAYREQVGTDANARKLYAEMVTANGALLEAVAEEPAKATARVQQRSQEMYQELFGNQFVVGFRGGTNLPRSVSAAEVCCVLFAAAQPAYKPGEPDWMLSNLYYHPAFMGPLKDARNGSAHRRLFFHYLDARMDDATINQCVWPLVQNRIRDGADVLAKALKEGKATQVYTKATAMCAVGTLGSREHVPVFEPFLKDETQVQPFFVGRGQRGEVQIRDVALAMTVYLSGRNPKDFGFDLWQVYPNQVIQYHQLGFGSDEDRARAFRKWAEEARRSSAEK